MATPETTQNPAAREFSRRARALKRQLDRAEQMIQLHPDDTVLVEIRDLLANAIQGHERGEVSSPQAEAAAMLAHWFFKFAELGYEREALRARGIEIKPIPLGGGR